MMLFIVYDNLETLLDITEFILFWGFTLNAMMKGSTMILMRCEIESILKGLIVRHPKTEEERVAFQLVPYFKTINASNKYLSMWHLSITSIFALHPMLASIYGYISREDENESFEFTLPFMMGYYYDTNRPLPYVITYFTQCCGAFYMSLLFLSGDLLLVSLVHLVNMHFGYLIYRIESFQPTGTDADMKVLGPLMEYHNEILDYAERIDSTFSLATLLNYVGTCLVLCLIGLQIALGSEILNVFKFLAFLISTIVQVFFVSYFGNNLKDLSTGISDAFYNHPWHDANYKYMRMLVIPIARAQRYAHLTAFKFFEISMDSFKSYKELFGIEESGTSIATEDKTQNRKMFSFTMVNT
uniref:Odorant receptor n=1 Tax=Bactrocera minax TaxID=104690 RepID=A0A3G2LEM2_9MUSC|nr:odorant receptor OR4-1 [Bactrocera minax]